MSVIPTLRGDSMYELFREELKGEVGGSPIELPYMATNPEWEKLDPHLQIAWGRLGRRLTQQLLNRHAIFEFDGHGGQGKRL